MLKRTYEAMVLLDNREVKKGWQNLKDEVCALFTKHGAEVKSAKRWDERRLAYPVKHQLRGTYMLMYIDSETSALTAISRDLDYYEPVLRHMTFACEEVPTDAFEPEAEFDEAEVRVEDTGSVRAAIAAEAAAAPPPPRRGDRGDRRDRGDRGEKAAPVEEKEAAPAEGEKAGKPAEGEKVAAPVEGEKTAAPAEGEKAAPAEGAKSEDAPAEGGDTSGEEKDK